MILLLTELQMATIRGCVTPQIDTEGFIVTQHCFLSELPGIVFGVVTLIWIVFTFNLLNR